MCVPSEEPRDVMGMIVGMGRLTDRLTRRRSSGPLLSVIVPIYNVEDYLDDCLDSILGQDHRNLEVIVVDDGSPDGSLAIAQRHAATDDRVRIVRRPNGGLSAARNTGVEQATGSYLTFVDSDDLVPAGAFRAAIESLETSHSDLAVLRYGRLREGKARNAAAWIRSLHATDRIGVTLAEVPEVMVNATAWSKVIRRDFYLAQGLRFVEGVIYEDQAFTAGMYAAAKAIDILTTTGYLWRVNDISISQGHVTVANLTARLDAADDSLHALEHHPARTDRALQLVRYNLPNSLLKLERADDDYLATLIDRLPRILGAVPADRYRSEVPAQYRVLYSLLLLGEHGPIWDFVRAEGMQPQMHPSGVEPAGFTVYLPGWGVGPVAAGDYVLTAEQTRFKASITGGHHTGPGAFELDVQAWFANVGDRPVVEATVLARGVPLTVTMTRSDNDRIVESRQGAQRRYAGSGWTVAVEGAGRRLPDTLDITLTATAGAFRGSKRFAHYRTSRLQPR